METYDIAIIGAGPAGSTLARLLPKTLKTVLLDGAAAHPERPGKPCGGLLAPDTQKMLAKHSLTLPRDVLVDPQIFSVKTMDTRSRLVRYYQRSYVNVDRARFDRWLCSIIPSNVRVLAAVASTLQNTAEGWEIHCSNGETLCARYLVGADGANSLVRKAIAPAKKIRTYVAIQQIFPADAATVRPSYACIFDPPTSDCCSWYIFKDNALIFGGAFAPHGCRAAFEKQKENLRPFHFALPAPTRTEACLVRRPRHLREICISNREGTAYLIGEAAGWISPSSLEGISWAMQSAEMLASQFEKAADSPSRLRKRYHIATRKLKMRLLGKIIKCPAMYVPFLRRLVMKSGLTSMQVVVSDEI